MTDFSPLPTADATASILSETSLFGGITEEQHDEIFSRVKIARFKRGETIFKEGDEPAHIYVVKSGLVALFISDQKIQIEKKQLGRGDCFGHVALISINRHNLSAVAVVDSEILAFSKESLHQLHHENSALSPC